MLPKWNYGTADAPVTVQQPSNDPMLTKHVINQANSLGFNPANSGIVTAARSTGVAPTTYNAQTGTVIAPQANSASQAIASGIKQTPLSSVTPISPLAASTPTVVPTVGTGLTSGKTAISPLGTTPTTQTGVPTTPITSTGQKTGISDNDFNTILASIDPNRLYTNEQKKSLRDTLSQSTAGTAKSLDLQTTGAKTALDEYKGIADAWRMQRDIVDQMDKNNIMNQRQVQDLTREYTIAKDKQKERMDADANNMSVMQGSTGRMQSRNMMNAVHQVLEDNVKVYNDLISQQDVMTKRLAQDLDMATKTLSKAYNDAVSDDMQKALQGINALDSTGAMNTKAGLIQARSVIDGMMQNKVTNLNSYYQGLNVLNEKYKAYSAEATAQKKVDQDLTKTMNDGYLYNANGTKIVNDSGVPLTYNPQKQIESAIKNDDGSTTILYKDGSFDTKQFGGTIGTEAVAGYAQLVSQGRLSLNDVPASIRSNVAMQASSMPQAGQWEFQNITDADGNVRTVQYNKTTNEIRDPTTGQTITPNMQTATDYSGNHDLRGLASKFPGQAWAKNNNPAWITWNGNFDNPKPWTTAYNLMQAGVNFEKGTPRPGNEWGNYVSFPTIEDGIKAQRIMMQVTYGNNTVWQMLQKWVWTSEGPRYAAQVAWNAGIDLKRKVSDLSEEELSQLQNAKIAKESPGLAKLLASPEFQASSKPAQYSPETDKNLEAVSQNANGVNYLDKTTNQVITAQQAMDKYGKVASELTTGATTTQQYTPSQKNLFEWYAKKVSDGTLTLKDRNSIANQLWVKPNELDNVYNQYVDSVSNAPKAPINVASLPLYKKYVEDGTLPSKDALKWLWMTSEQFVDSAGEWYDKFLREKENEINSVYPTLNIEFTPSYNNISATQKEKLNESLTKIWDIDQRIGQLKKLFEENGTEVLPTKAKSVMETLRKQIILKAKEVENLWVLNGPDLWILEDLLPSTTWVLSWMFSFDKNTLAKLDNIQENYRSDAKTKWINYWTKISFKEKQSEQLPNQITKPFVPNPTASWKSFNIDLWSGWLAQDDHDEINSLMQ